MMLQPHYQTVFEIGPQSFPWSDLMHPIPFIIVGLLLFRFAKGKEIYQIIGIIVAALATVFFLILSVSLVPDFLELRSAYKSGDRSVVEGTVDDFHPAPALGAAKESFSVNGIVFS